MNIKFKRVIQTVLLAFMATFSSAQTGGNYTLAKITIDGGGGNSDGGNYFLVATIGQTDASNSSIGGNFALSGGFWAKAPTPLPEQIFKDSFE